MSLRVSKLGLTVGIVFLLTAGTLFAMHLHALATDDAGADSALLFFLLTLPWALLLPEWLVTQAWWDQASYYVSWLFVGLNAFALYCIAGGIGLRTDDRASRRGTKPDLHAVRDG